MKFNNNIFIEFFSTKAFHDCVGGCDGCINIDDSHNNGLQDCLEDLEVLYDSETIAGSFSKNWKFWQIDKLLASVLLATGISRADFWVMASYAAIGKLILFNPKTKFNKKKCSL